MKRNVASSAGIVGIALFGFFLLLTILNPGLLTHLSAEEKIGADKPPIIMNEHIRALNNALEDASKAIVPTVVSIRVMIKSSPHSSQYREEFKEFFKFFGQPDDEPDQQEGGGSGVFISPDGYIVTNNHVVENATEIKVTTDDKKELKAKLIGTDPYTDLAVIKIEGSNYPYVHFGDMENVKVGEIVIAVGNPLGLNSTVTEGIVSAIGRGGLSLLRDKGGYGVENFIQTDAAINPGNSGGGLFNLEGSLVGINTAIATKTGTYIGYGFAIPIDIVKPVISEIIKSGKVTRGYIGVQIRTIDELAAKSLGLDKVEGAVVNDVIKDSPGEKAGIEPGDVILEINGKPLKTSNDLQAEVIKHRPGENVSLAIWRDGKKFSKTVKLEPKDLTDNEAQSEAVSGESEAETPDKSTSFDKLGFTVEPLTKQQKNEFKLENGVAITKVERNGQALQRGIMPNGIITKVDRQKISSVKQLKKLIENKKSGEPLLLQIKYKDSNRIIALEMP